MDEGVAGRVCGMDTPSGDKPNLSSQFPSSSNSSNNTPSKVQVSSPNVSSSSTRISRVLTLLHTLPRPLGHALLPNTNPSCQRESGHFSICDIVSQTILLQMWHISDKIFCYLDADSLQVCEQVCSLWKCYIVGQKVWKRALEMAAKSSPELVKQNGWSSFLPNTDNDVQVYKDTYWKLTNLGQLWANNQRNLTEYKNHFKRPGPITWKFLPGHPQERAVSVYNSGRGFVVKVHDRQTHKFRSSLRQTMGAVKKDTLCLDATQHKIAVGGAISQKVWVFNIEQMPLEPPANFFEFLTRNIWAGTDGGHATAVSDHQFTVQTYLHKFINATAGVAAVKFHSDERRLAVLLPLNQIVEVWDVNVFEVLRLQSFAVPSDSAYLVWSKEMLLVAPVYSGILQMFDTLSDKEMTPIVGSFRRIDAVAVYENLAATGEGRCVKLWSLANSRGLVTWVATKTVVSCVFLNDTMVASGSSAGIVKLWDLKALLRKNASSVVPLRKISMKGVMRYPIKNIFQFSYTDLVIVAKYEAKKRKDKIKVVQV